MALVVSELIEEARDRSPAFDRRRHPDPLLVRQLSHEQRRLVAKILKANASAISEVETIDVSEYDFAAGHTMPAFHRIDGAYATLEASDSDPRKVREINWANRFDPTPRYGYAVHAGKLWLSSDADRWEGVLSVDVDYTPIPAALNALDAELIVPETAGAYLTAYLAHVMGLRSATTDQVPVKDLLAEKLEAESDFLEAVRATYRAKVIRVQPVW